MTDPLMIIYVFGLLAFLLAVTVIYARKPKQETTSKDEKKPTPTKSRRDEILDSLEWMQQNQILDNTEYNKLLVKCLPFLE